MPKINDFLRGFQDGLPGMKDYRHANRLFTDDDFKLLPKQKFLFYCVIRTNEDVSMDDLTRVERMHLNMLCKTVELPRFGMNVQEKIQYNKKVYPMTRIQYEPVNITFHDDHADTVTAFWKKYYEHYVADAHLVGDTATRIATKDSYFDDPDQKQTGTTKWGLDTPVQRRKPYLDNIEIFMFHRQRFTSMMLINPVIGSFNHDTLDVADGTGTVSSTMQVLYESVVYASGVIKNSKEKIHGFTELHYDHEPSPLSVLGGGTNSIFGPGGVVDGVGSVIRNIGNKNILGAILSASNTYNNAKKIKKAGVKEELKGLGKKGIQEIGKHRSLASSGVGQFAIGAMALGVGRTLATESGKTTSNNPRINNATPDSVNYLTADESYNLVISNSTLKNAIAAGIYYKDIGSRKGLTIAESDVEYTGSTATAKTVYRNKAITDIRKLVTEGYIKISRDAQNVSIVTEKANL
jgi:hypothetical protein|tara:strand:- start:458 stop:1849 length:1392 start_codon:yes stop_codon:yes gene_type:complete